jgi:hypothetical protein
MTKRAISETLDGDDVTWLKGRAGAGRVKSVSHLVNRLIADARASGAAADARSVVGTIDIDATDPLLSRADAAVRRLFDAAIVRPLIARDRSGAPRPRGPKTRRG